MEATSDLEARGGCDEGTDRGAEEAAGERKPALTHPPVHRPGSFSPKKTLHPLSHTITLLLDHPHQHQRSYDSSIRFLTASENAQDPVLKDVNDTK